MECKFLLSSQLEMKSAPRAPGAPGGVVWRLEEMGEDSGQLLMENAIEMNKKPAKPH